MMLSPNDCYTWWVTYQDGSIQAEYDEDRPDGRGFAEIKQEPVTGVSLVADTEAQTTYSVSIPEGATPVFFRRRTFVLNMQGEKNQGHTVHCLGWKRGEDGEGVYLFVFEDGTTLLTTDFQAV